MKKVLDLLLGKYLLIPKEKLTYSNDLLYTYHNADFINEKRFKKAYQLGKATDKNFRLKNYDIEWRVHVVCWAAKHASNLEGDFVECGVHTGIYARAIIDYINFQKTKKKFYLLDTFKGLDSKYSTAKEMTRNQKMGYEERGDIYKEVAKTFKNFNVDIIQGPVPETLSKVKAKKISFLSIDMNSVKPESESLKYFWPKLVKGGIIVLDDYGYANSTNDQKKAHDKFANQNGVEVLSLPTCQGIIIKPYE